MKFNQSGRDPTCVSSMKKPRGRGFTLGGRVERVKGIEPSYAAWEAAVLPLNYTRRSACILARPATPFQDLRAPLFMYCSAAPSLTEAQSTWSARNLLQWSCTLRKVSFAAACSFITSSLALRMASMIGRDQ